MNELNLYAVDACGWGIWAHGLLRHLRSTTSHSLHRLCAAWKWGGGPSLLPRDVFFVISKAVTSSPFPRCTQNEHQHCLLCVALRWNVATPGLNAGCKELNVRVTCSKLFVRTMPQHSIAKHCIAQKTHSETVVELRLCLCVSLCAVLDTCSHTTMNNIIRGT